MKKFSKLFTITLVLIIAFKVDCYCQYVPISIEQKIEKSKHIVEGKVIAQQSYLGSDNEVYTENLIKVVKKFKGNLSLSEIAITTRGGLFGDKSTYWSHMLSLDNNVYGTFFLVETNLPTRPNSPYSNFVTYSGEQGFYHYIKDDIGYKVKSILDGYTNPTKFYSKINVDESLRTLEFIEFDEVNLDSCIVYKIEPQILSSLSSGTTVALRIFVKNKGGEFRLNQGQLFLEYSTEWFYENMVSNGHLSYFEGDFNENYNLTIQDYASNSVQIDLVASSSNYSDLEVINDEFKLVATINVEVKSISDENPIEEDFSISNFSNTYRTSDGYIREFDCVKVEHGVNCGMSITSITPLAAAGVGLESENGITGVIEIIGENFLDDEPEFKCGKPVDHHVRFNTIDGSWIIPFEEDYLEYTDTRIRVKVPTVGIKPDCETPYTDNDINDAVACTGQIQVCRPHWLLGRCCGCRTTSSNELYVPFAARNRVKTNDDGCRESLKFVLQDSDNSGGYTWRFDSSFTAIAGAVDAFKRAVTTWRCATQVNFKIDETNPPATGDGLCTAKMGMLDVGTRGATSFTLLSNCFMTDIHYPERIEITFNEDIDWHTGKDMPTDLNWNDINVGTLEADLESTSLHELGHAHLLLHTCNSDNVMARPGPLDFRRDLTSDDEDGGIHLSLLGNNTNGCDGNMALINPSECDVTSVIEINGKEISVSVFPNPASSIISIQFDESIVKNESYINLIDVNGRILRNSEALNIVQFDISDLNQGIYFIGFEDSTGIQLIEKFTKID